MAIIYTYPTKATPANDDLILISDSADSNKTKQIKVSSLPGGSAAGVSSFNTLTGAVTITGGTNVTLNPVGNNIEINAAGGGGTPSTPLNSVQFNNASAFGGSANLTFTTNTLAVTHTVDIKGDGANAGKLKLYCENTTTPHAVTIEGPAHSGATAYTLKLPSPAPANNQVLEYENSTNNLRWINTPASTAPQGDDGQYQYKNGSSFSGADNLRFDADKIHIGKGGATPTRGQLVMYGDGTNASDIQLYNSGNSRSLIIAQQAGATQDLTLTFPGVAPGGNDKILQSDSSGQLSWISTPTGATYSAMTTTTLGLGKLRYTTGATPAAVAQTTTANRTYGVTENSSNQLVVNVPWTNTDTNTNIANTNLQLDNNRTLDFNDNATARSLTFINTNGGSKNLFKFEQTGGTAPYLYVGHTESAYEGYVVLEGNGSNRTGQVQFENAAGTYYTSIKAPNTFGANQNIAYTLPNLQGAANSVLTNNGSGTLSWTTTSEPTEITGTTAVNTTTFANTPYTFESTSATSGSGAPFATKVGSSAGSKHIAFYYQTTLAGSISQNGTNAVAYNTSSDYRLKENVVDMTGAVDRLKQLKPSRFNFIADGPSRTVDGFLAHEVSSIVPEAVTGSKDAVDADNNIIPQGIDQSKLVPLLVGAIKELTARIEALEA